MKVLVKNGSNPITWYHGMEGKMFTVSYIKDFHYFISDEEVPFGEEFGPCGVHFPDGELLYTAEEYKKLNDQFQGSLGNAKDVMNHNNALTERNLKIRTYNESLLNRVRASEVANTELKQANLMHVENEKVFMRDREALDKEVGKLSRQVESLRDYGNKKVEKVIRLRNEWDVLYAEHQTVLSESDLLLAQVERAMLDHQPVVLSKEVANKIQALRNEGYTDYMIIGFVTEEWKRTDDQQITEMSEWAYRHPSPFLRALADGYTIEQTPEEANEAAFRVGMEAIYKEMDELKYTEAFNWQIEFTDKLIPLIKEIYQH